MEPGVFCHVNLFCQALALCAAQQDLLPFPGDASASVPSFYAFSLLFPRTLFLLSRDQPDQSAQHARRPDADHPHAHALPSLSEQHQPCRRHHNAQRNTEDPHRQAQKDDQHAAKRQQHPRQPPAAASAPAHVHPSPPFILCGKPCVLPACFPSHNRQSPKALPSGSDWSDEITA